MRVLGWMLVMASLPGVCVGQGECFRTVREAALQNGVRDGEGFRLEGVTADRVGGGKLGSGDELYASGAAGRGGEGGSVAVRRRSMMGTAWLWCGARLW